MSKARELSQLGDKIDIDDTTGDFAVDTDTLYVDVSANRVGIGLNTNISSALHVNSEASLGPDNNNRMILGSTSGGVGSIGTIEGGTASFDTMTFKGGKVGIGTGSPQVTFDCQDDSALAASISGYSVASSASRPASGALRIGSGAGSTGLLLDYHDGGQTKATIRNQYVSSNDSELSIESPHITFNTGTSYAERMRIDSSGNVLVGRTDNPSGVSNCVYALGNYGITTGSGANVHINSEGLFFRSTSSKRYKNTIQDATHGLTELLTLRPVTFKNNEDGDRIYGGLIAEEVHEAGLTEFVQYNDDNEPDALDYGNMVSLCIKAIQEQQATITAQAAKIETLETENTAIKARLDALEAE